MRPGPSRCTPWLGIGVTDESGCRSRVAPPRLRQGFTEVSTVKEWDYDVPLASSTPGGRWGHTSPIITPVPVPVRLARAAAQPLSAATLAHQAAATARRMCDSPRFAHDHGVAVRTAAWSAALMADWCDAVREPRRTGPIEATPGFRLAALVARYAQRVFDTRASLLNDERADEYRRRSRDPAPSVASLVRPRPAVSVVRCAAADTATAAVPAASVAPPPPRS